MHNGGQHDRHYWILMPIFGFYLYPPDDVAVGDGVSVDDGELVGAFVGVEVGGG